MDEDLIKRLYELYCVCMDEETLTHCDLNKFMEFFKTRSNEVVNRNFRNILNDYINTNKFKYINMINEIDMIDELKQLINTYEYNNLIIAFELIYKRFSFK